MFKGSIVALITPFKDDKLDEEKYEELKKFNDRNDQFSRVSLKSAKNINYHKNFLTKNDEEFQVASFGLRSGEKIERSNIFGRTIQKIGYLIN